MKKQHLSVPEYLLAVRSAREFTAQAIRQEVVRVFCKKNNSAVPDSNRGIKDTYRKALEGMGYGIVRYHPGLPLADDPCILATFETKHSAHYADHESHNTSQEKLERHLQQAVAILKRAGFARAFCHVIVTNDFRSAFAKFFPDLAPAEHVTWYVLTKTLGEVEDFPHGGFFQSDGHPCLMISPPSKMTGIDTSRLLDMRICHETAHYCLNHTLFREDQSPGSTKILETAGEVIASIVALLIEELFALLMTCSFFGEEYLKLAPAVRLPDETPIRSNPATPKEWLRVKQRHYLAMQDFLFSYPWACACRMSGLHSQADAIVSNYPSELRAAVDNLAHPLSEICRYATLIPFRVMNIVQTLEDQSLAPYLRSWESMSKLFAAYGEEWRI